ncbi:MAG: competence/damage-inducible protein A [Tannerella sp.]|jgi:nicotinamide-nucleotide amidase|nr:competence/damage-inducible protein A [Tannerella sp.]
MDVEIITIGDELLIGQVVDTNSAFMATLLNDNGFRVIRKTTIGDEEDDIIAAIDAARQRARIILVTGGLGPTKDDITLRTLCRYFNCQLHFSEEVYANIERIFQKRGRTMNPLTRNQAMVPNHSTVIQNQVGTAPCTWFEKDEMVLVSMPGVPGEMEWLMTNEIVPRLKNKYQQDIHIQHQTSWVTGYSESELAMILSDFEQNMPPFVKLAYLPQLGIIRLRLSAYAKTKEEAEAEKAIAILQTQLKQLLKEHLIVETNESIEALVGDLLRTQKKTVGTAESCTGGNIAALLTSIAGSSDYFMGSIVSYTNSVKNQVLGVSENDLKTYGAVSKQVVEQMAQGALNVLGCDYAIATSGIAGPGGGTPEKPVGTIWIAVACKNRVISEVHHFNMGRTQNIKRTVNFALLLLLQEISE